MESKPTNYKPSNIFLFRGPKESLEENNRIYEKYVLIAELPDDAKDNPKEELFGVMCKYKIGDSVHRYKDLPYQDGLIPVAFKLPTSPVLTHRDGTPIEKGDNNGD